jgi:hypothetical protein
VAGIDYGTVNNFACVLMGVSTGRYTQTGICRWAEKEYVWDSKKMGRQKTNSEYADDVIEFLEPYGVKAVYVDPSAAAFKVELRKRGVHVVDADNDVLNGITFMTSEMRKGNLFICKDCEYLISETESYVWDSKAAEKGYDEPLKKADHCFCAGTMITTINGQIPIEKLNVGDLVLTREGYKPIMNVGPSISPQLIKQFNLYGKSIRCTPDHKFYTLRGWVEIENLIQSDILFTMENLWESSESAKSSSLIINDTDVILSLLGTMIGITSLAMEDISIEIFGKKRMDQFPKDVIYITKTKTPITMIYPIWNALQDSSISHIIKMILNQITSLINVEQLLPFGINQNKEENGTSSMQKILDLDKKSLLNEDATNAIPNMKLKTDQIQDFVRITVSQNGEEKLVLTMRIELAMDAILHLPQINIAKSDHVLANVQADTETTETVYNLNVKDCHEYFAEGILVKNCMDALRYALFTHKVSVYNEYLEAQNQQNYLKNRFQRTF